MPIDMPPQPVAYHVERPAPVGQTPDFRAIVAASRAVSERLRVSEGPSLAQSLLPGLDPASPAMTDQDRSALVGAMRADWGAGMAEGRLARPDSYVGDRIGVAHAFANARLSMAAGSLDSVDAHAVQCRVVALALDARAGRYLAGGEVAAQRARSAVTPEMRRDCAASIEAARGRTAPPQVRAAVPVAGRADAARTLVARVDQPVRPALRASSASAVVRTSVSYPVQLARGIGD